MAKVGGPLFSIEASGAFAKTVVFAKWKGRQYARNLVTPANPRSAGQEAARNNMRVSGAAQKWVNGNTQVHAEATLSDKEEITAKTPSGQAWNGFLVDQMIGSGAVNIDASDSIWGGLSGAEQTAWDDAADALITLMPAVAQTVAGGGAATPKSSGNLFINYEYALFVMGIVNVPAAVPPAYA